MLDNIVAKSQQQNKDRKPVAFFTVASKSHFKYALTFLKTLTKFHKPSDIDIILFTDEDSQNELQKLPKGIQIRDLTPYLQDQLFWYRQKPVLMEPLLAEYELVVGFDTDQLVLGSLQPIIEAKDYDVGVVINWNRFDEKFYPPVEIMRLGVVPANYYNCGLVAARSKKFVHNWLVNCFTQEFNFMQYKEQDVLNILTHFGNYNVRCFDMPNDPNERVNWYGILGKGEWVRSELDGRDIIVKKGFGDTPFPPTDVHIRIAHMGGGHNSPKDNWGTLFPPEVMKRIEELMK